MQIWSYWSSKIKRAGKPNITERGYHVQNDAHVARKNMEMFCNKNQFPLLSFCVLHTKPHGVGGLSKNHHMLFDIKLGYGIFTRRRIPCACA